MRLETCNIKAVLVDFTENQRASDLLARTAEWSQGYQRLGEALLELQEFEEAEENFSKGTKLAPTNRDMQSLLKKSRVQAC